HGAEHKTIYAFEAGEELTADIFCGQFFTRFKSIDCLVLRTMIVKETFDIFYLGNDDEVEQKKDNTKCTGTYIEPACAVL
ncbi:MAG: DUF1385 domain-containing protein, partial [Candidatus Marinimicrobia bacterium]|nr:DUF1385 domain-containing protein [Candidatus Neomarinimicrobiota bacterium]